MTFKCSKFFLIVFAAALLARSALAGAPARKLAIVIGINTYDDPSIARLKFCVKDAKAVYHELVTHCGYDPTDVLLMHDEFFGEHRHKVPSRVNIERMVKSWLDLAEPDDTVVFFFSGHGFLSGEGRGYLATTDCLQSSLDKTALPTQQLRDLLNGCKAKRRFLILDCCHAAAGGTRGESNEPQQLANNFGTLDQEKKEINQLLLDSAEGLVTLASCMVDQKSREWEEEGLGLFTFFLTKGLRGAADLLGNRDGIVDHQELLNYTQAKVRSTSFKRYGVEQTPVLYPHENARGVFPLAEVKNAAYVRKYVDRDYLLPTDLATSQTGLIQIPQPPGKKAQDAFNRLSDSARSGDLQSRLSDAKILIQEAGRLRRPQLSTKDGQDGRKLVSTRNPFFDEQRAEDVYKWLTASRSIYSQLDRATPRELDVSLALAAAFQATPDETSAAAILDQLHPFDKAAEDVQAQLWLAYARTRDTSTTKGKLAAIQSYARLLRLIQDSEQKTGLTFKPQVLADDVLKPALASSLGIDDEQLSRDSKQQLASVYGTYGLIIDKHDFFAENEDALQYLQRAVELDSGRPKFYLGLGRLLNKARDRDFEAIRRAAHAALQQIERAGDPQTVAVANQMIGSAWVSESKLRGHGIRLDNRIAALDQGIDAFDRAISNFQQLEKAKVLSQSESRDFARCYLSRSAACLDKANLDAGAIQARESLLKQAAEDAATAGKRDSTVGYEAYLALGNALENQAWILGKKGAYAQAVDAFDKAVELRIDKVDAFINLGRVDIKRGRLENGIRSLLHSLKLGERTEAYYWISKAHLEKKQFDEADRNLRQAVELANQAKDLKAFDRFITLKSYAKLPVSHCKYQLGRNDLSNTLDLLQSAQSRANRLREFQQAECDLIYAESYALESIIRTRRGETERTRQLYQAALTLYDKLTKHEDLDARVRIETHYQRCALICESKLWEGDVQRTPPTALTSALTAIQVANNELSKLRPNQVERRKELTGHLSVALGWAGLTHSKLVLHHRQAAFTAAKQNEAAQVKHHHAQADQHAIEAKSHLQNSLMNCTDIKFDKKGALVTRKGMKSHHPSSWKWSLMLAYLREADAHRAKGRDENAFDTARSEGCRLFDFTVANCPESQTERQAAVKSRTKLYRLKF